MSRLKALLHAQHDDATTQRNAHQDDLLHVARPRECNVQQQADLASEMAILPLKSRGDVPQSGVECTRCRNIDMQQGPGPGGRRTFQWTCTRGHRILRGGVYLEDVLIAPPDCTDYDDTPPVGGGVYH